MRPTERYQMAGMTPSTPLANRTVTFAGGYYQFAAVSPAWGGGNVRVRQRDPTGAGPSFFLASLSADGVVNFFCPPGTYFFAVTTTATVDISVTRIPVEHAP